MIVVTGNKNNEVFGIGSILEYWSNGYPVLKSNLEDIGTAYLPEQVTVYEKVQNIPETVKPYEYCYTPEKGFYLNPNWKELNEYGLTDEEMEEIKASYREELTKEVAKHGYDA